MTSPDQLSPRRLSPPRPAPLPFGLTWADLEDALPGASAGGHAVVSHARRGRHRGGHPSVIMTLSCGAPSGPPRQRTLFFKLNRDGSREAHHHRFLAERGVPVPHLAVCVERAHEEVLGLEFLPSVGLGPADVDDVLRLVAALNALTDVPDAVGQPPPGRPQAEFEHLLAQTLEQLGPARADRGPASWFTTYRRAAALHRDLPTALTHGELAAQQVGRTAGGRLVMFDLATAGRRPRFADIANLLATAARLSGQDERSVLGDYLRHLSPTGAAATVDDQTWAELRLTRYVQAVEALPWRLGLGRPAELRRHLDAVEADHRAVLAGLAS
ncbi:hypothetical protein SAMN04488543_2472 [Friedmanniella luteola]|uniref:Phosphotransferase enzyme family protein n=1 Tax=Friedmanniella luteola TaxID=546871 RepID=A0A1H1VGG5_9ACTN|nr:hypothetical protein [Friedmanniella luteola]SDS83446.1 hypothetical protein SAMN04488543_2472 [Friedmanniella luteola]